MKSIEKQIWRYLDGELTQEERTRFEQELQEDSALQRALEERNMTDRVLKNTAIDELVKEFEAEHPDFRETAPPSKIIRLMLPLAAAAAAVILLTAQPWQRGPVDWLHTSLGSAPQVRGETGATPAYTRSDLRQLNATLRKAIESHLENYDRPPKTWTMKIEMQELALGAIAIEVSSPPSSKVWKATFQTPEQCRQNLPRFGKQIAMDLMP